MSNQEQLTHSDNQIVRAPRRKLGSLAAGLALAGGIAAGVGIAANNDSTPKKEVVTSQETFEQVLENVTHPTVGDKFKVAQATFTLEEGATVTDGNGKETILTDAIYGIQNPAWTPKKDTLCFLQQKDMATCFDISKNDQYIVAQKDFKGGFQEVPLNIFTPEGAPEATVNLVEPDGFAYGQVDIRTEVLDQYIAGRPTN